MCENPELLPPLSGHAGGHQRHRILIAPAITFHSGPNLALRKRLTQPFASPGSDGEGHKRTIVGSDMPIRIFSKGVAPLDAVGGFLSIHSIVADNSPQTVIEISFQPRAHWTAVCGNKHQRVAIISAGRKLLIADDPDFLASGSRGTGAFDKMEGVTAIVGRHESRLNAGSLQDSQTATGCIPTQRSDFILERSPPVSRKRNQLSLRNTLPLQDF